jgi:hypothetical protein
LLLAYTNKFLAIANLIRKLITDYHKRQHHNLMPQISSLKRRLTLIRWMQVFGIASILFCVITMFLIYAGFQTGAKILFGFSLLLMIISLVISIIEIFLSAGALRVVLREIELKEKR